MCLPVYGCILEFKTPNSSFSGLGMSKTWHKPFWRLIIALGCYLVDAPSSHSGERTLLPHTYQRLRSGEPVTIVCLGDSVTGIYYHSGGRRAYPEMLQIALNKQFPKAKVRVINAGISGDTTALAWARLENDVLQHRPHLVTVMFGLNDVARLPLDDYRQNLAKISKRVADAGSEVLLCTPNGVEATPDRPLAKVSEFVAAARALGTQQRLPVADVFAAYEEVRSKDATEFSLLLSDPLHPNMDGHKRSAAVIARAISGREISLENEAPLSPAIPHTLSLLLEKQPIKVLAMPPYDTLVGPILKKLDPEAKIEVSTWEVAGKSLGEIEEDAKNVRELRPDLVIVAVPLVPSTEPVPGFARSYGWILSRSLSFGIQEWDVLALPPSLAEPVKSESQRLQDKLVQRLIAAQDLSLIARQPNDHRPAADVLSGWFEDEFFAARDKQGK